MSVHERLEALAHRLDAASIESEPPDLDERALALADSGHRRGRVFAAGVALVIVAASAYVLGTRLPSEPDAVTTLDAVPSDLDLSDAPTDSAEVTTDAADPDWRLISEFNAGTRWSTAVALTAADAPGALASLGVGDSENFEVDWSSEILVLLGSPVSSSCPDQTIVGFGQDDIGSDVPVLFPTLGVPDVDGIMACSTDAVPRVFALAVQRAGLPAAFVVAPTSRTPCTHPCTPHVLTEVNLGAGTTDQREG